jgi:AcrR family transcriptional regulator
MTRSYRQDARAQATAEDTQRVIGAALELFLERPFDQVTLIAVAERAGVGLQSVIRRVGTKDGLVVMVNEWIGPQVAATLGDPATVAGAADVADRFCTHYERWARLIERTLHQSDVSPAVTTKPSERAWPTMTGSSRPSRTPWPLWTRAAASRSPHVSSPSPASRCSRSSGATRGCPSPTPAPR